MKAGDVATVGTQTAAQLLALLFPQENQVVTVDDHGVAEQEPSQQDDHEVLEVESHREKAEAAQQQDERGKVELHVSHREPRGNDELDVQCAE